MRLGKDVVAKWILERAGRPLLQFVGLPPVESLRPVPPETAVPRRIPDGLYQVQFAGQPAETPFLIEIENTPAPDADRQMRDAIMAVALANRQIPDALLILLQPRGNADVAGEVRLASAADTVRGLIQWRVVKLWEVDAETLFALGDPALAPFITLARTTQPPEEFLKRCREFIDARTPPDRLAEVLAVTTIMAGVHYNERRLLDFFMTEDTMITSPVLDRLALRIENNTQCRNIMDFLTDRFGDAAQQVAGRVTVIADSEILRELVKWSAMCPDLAAFEQRL